MGTEYQFVQYIIYFAIAFFTAFFLTPLVKKVAFNIGAVDVPKDNRRMHKTPTALIGGLAIYGGFIAVIAYYVVYRVIDAENLIDDTRLLGLLLGSIIIVLTGIMDDIKPLSAKTKLIFQIIAASLVVATGTHIEEITNPFSPTGMTYLGIWGKILTVIWIIGVTNAINLIDGLDGLAAGVSSISSLSLMFIFIFNNQPECVLLTAALAGSTLGFLPYNFNPAKIFMGDTGAMFLGFALATVSVMGLVKTYTAVAVAIPLLVLGLPIFDTAMAIIRRLINKKPIMQADRGHLHHKLIDKGFTQKQTVITLYVISAFLGICAIELATSGIIKAIILLLAVGIFILAGAKYLDNMSDGKEGIKLLKGNIENTNSLAEENEEKKKDKDENQKEIKVMSVFGTRPEAIKMAPLVKELENREGIDSKVCVTAQHRQMLDQVLEIFNIKPDYDLNIMQERQTLAGITSRAMEGLHDVFEKEMPDIVLVHGDTTTTFAASLAAFYNKTTIGHVEAGLRTFDKYAPYPEEMNRKLTTALADFYFAPTKSNEENLLKESIPESKIYLTGNTVIDAIGLTVDKEYKFKSESLAKVDFSKKVILVTAHRRENLGEPLENICNALREIAKKYNDIEIVYPVHLNPAVQEVAKRILGNLKNVHLIEPLDVQDLHNVMDRCYLVATDSGGIQEEAPALGKPVLVLRNETERPEAIEAGTVKLAGTNKDMIVNMMTELIDNKEAYDEMAKAANPYGDGLASKRIVDVILRELGGNKEIKIEEFNIVNANNIANQPREFFN